VRINVFGGNDKVPTGTYVDHTHHSPRIDTRSLINDIEWVFDGTGECEMYIDEAIQQGFEGNFGKKKYAWLLESKAIIPHVYNFVEQQLDACLSIFDLIFTNDKSLYEKHERIKFVPANTLWVKELGIADKTKLVSMIVSGNQQTDGHRYRLEWMNKFLGKVDIYGRQINPIDKKEDGLKDYMFSIAMENSKYETYFTEKILDCFAMGTIPVYWGTPDIGEHFNLDGIIIFDDNFSLDMLTPELYYSKIEAVKENFERVKEYQVLENYISGRYFNASL